MSFMLELKKPAILAYATNWIFGIGIIQYPLGKFHPKISLVYSITTLSIYCIIAACDYSYFLELRVAENFVSIKLLYYSSIIMTISYVAFGWYRSKGLRVCVSKLILADDLLERIGISTNYESLWQRYVIKTFIGLSFVLTCIIVDSAIGFPKDMSSGEQILTAITMSYPVFVMFAGDSGFLIIVRKVKFAILLRDFSTIFLRQKLCLFNSHISRKFNSLNELLKSKLTSSEDLPLHKRIIRFRNNDLQNSSKKDESSTIETSRQAHLELVESSQLANELYGLQMLLSIAAALVMITVELYNMFTSTRYEMPAQKLHITLILSIVWISYYIIKIYVFSWICTRCTQNARETGDIINELYDEPFISLETRRELRNFLIQLLKIQVNFTVYGFIDLDVSLMHVITGSITTYLMILIQFRNMTDNSNCNAK